jgi:hypothetical protein
VNCIQVTRDRLQCRAYVNTVVTLRVLKDCFVGLVICKVIYCQLYNYWGAFIVVVLKMSWGVIVTFFVSLFNDGILNTEVTSNEKRQDVRFEVRTALTVKIAVFWDVTPCNLEYTDRRIRGKCCFHHQIRRRRQHILRDVCKYLPDHMVPQ